VTQVRLLGGVGAVDAAGDPLDVGPPKCRLTLAALALSRGEAVPVPRLVDLVWGEEPPATARKILQGYVSQLRRVLGPGAIATVAAAYRLERDVAVDVHRFRSAAADGDIDGALALWAGPPLAGLDPVGLQPAVDGLVEQWLDMVEQQLARTVDDDPAAAVGPLTELVADHPGREGAWASLMLALARSDRQADALAAYRRAREHLVEELGIDPGERLQRMEAEILAGEVGTGPPRPTPAPAGAHRATPPAPANLPAAPDLVDRAEDVAVVGRALRTAALVTLVGPGGIGKTSLAVAVARAWHEQGDGRACFVALDQVRAPQGVVRVTAEALGVADPADGDLLQAVVAATASRSTLLVLDNCEHVLPGAAALVAAMAAGAPTTRVLATSRERLGAVREHLHPVESLSAEGGVELFVRRAAALAPGVDLHGDRPVIEELCRELDGLPLAIELAAARIRSLTPVQLHERLGDRLRLLAAGRGSQRQATLHGAVAWSHDLLTAEQQRVFARLSVFAGQFDLAAVEAVVADEVLDAIDVDRLLGDLVERSMVATSHAARGRRFRLLETLRHFAADRLEEAGEQAALERRHAAWVAAETARVGGLLAGHDEAEGVARLDELWPNLRTAVERAVDAGNARLAGDLVRPVVTETSFRRRAEIGVWAERILDITPPDDEDEALFWLSWALHRHMQSGNTSAFDALVERHGHRDHPLVRACHWYLYEDGAALADAGPEAEAWLRERGHGLAADLARLSFVGSGLMTSGNLDELVDVVPGWVARHAEHGPATMHYFSLGMLGYAEQFRGDHDAARRWFLAAADVEVPSGTYAASRPAEAQALFEQGEHARALRLLRDNVDDVLDAGTVDVARLVAVAFVNLMAGLGRLDDAAPALAYLDTVGEFGQMARASLVADAAARIGEVAPWDHDAGAALRHMQACLASG